VDEQPPQLLQPCAGCGATLDVSDEEPLAEVTCPACGTVNAVGGMIGPFELVEVLGHGGMGVVYKARDVSLDRLVALKLLHREESEDPAQIEKLASEAAITASINHPNVVKVFTTGTDRERFYIAMELVDKGTLDSLITLQERVAETQALEIGIQIAKGLRAALQHGLIHRDIKPGNILFADAHTAKIVDFGLAMLAEDAAAARGEVWGTPYYVAPEKLDQKPEDFRSDIYSLGATLFHAIAGRPPFEAENASLVALKHLKSEAVSLQAFAPWVSGSTAFVINRTLTKDPDQRYQSYDELIAHLEYARAELDKKSGLPPEAPKRLVIESAEQQNAMSWVVLGLLALMLIGGGGFLAYRLWGGGKPAPASLAGATRGSRFDAAYESARQQLLSGHASEAAGEFAKLGEAKLKRPMLDWVNFHEALARFRAGQLDEAQAALRKIESRGRERDEKDARARKAIDFLVEHAAAAASRTPVPMTVAGRIDTKNYEGLALLLFGLQNWHLQRFPEADFYFGRFDAMQPIGSEWLAEYKPLAADYLSDLRQFRDASTAVKMATSPEMKRRAATVLEDARKSLKVGAPLTERLESMRKGLGPLPPPAPPKPAVRHPAQKKAP
jgi:hypothetical protein